MGFSNLLTIINLVSKEVVPIFAPTSKVWEYLFIFSLAYTWDCQTNKFANLTDEITYLTLLICFPSSISEVELTIISWLTILVLSFVYFQFISLSHGYMLWILCFVCYTRFKYFWCSLLALFWYHLKDFQYDIIELIKFFCFKSLLLCLV